MTKKQHKTRLHPFRLLVLVLYHEQTWASWDDGRICINTPQAARVLGVSGTKVRDYCLWLSNNGYIDKLRPGKESVSFLPVFPRNLYPSHEYDNIDTPGDSKIEFTLEQPRVCDDQTQGCQSEEENPNISEEDCQSEALAEEDKLDDLPISWRN